MAFACFHPESCGLKREVVLLFEGVSAEFARLTVFSANVDGFRNEKRKCSLVKEEASPAGTNARSPIDE
jgi:hypothetical protein